MTTSLSSAPLQTDVTAEIGSGRLLDTLALYAHLYGGDAGGAHQRTMLLAAVLIDRFHLDSFLAVDLARNDAFDPRVREAGAERDRLLDQARRTADQAEAVA